MRTTTRATAACTLLLAGLISSVSAEPPASSANIQHAINRLEAARLQLKLYERVDYPLRLRLLNDEIELAKAETESLQRQVVEYESFDGSEALFLTLERTRLQRRRSETHWKRLKYERMLLQRHHLDERRLRKLLIAQAAEAANASP